MIRAIIVTMAFDQATAPKRQRSNNRRGRAMKTGKDEAGTRRLIRMEPAGPVLRLAVGGVWALSDGLTDPATVGEALGAGGIDTLAVRCEGLERADSALMVYLTALHDLAAAAGVRFDVSGVDAGISALVALARAVPEQAGTGHVTESVARIDRVGSKALAAAREVNSQIQFYGELALSFGRLFTGRARLRWRDVLEVLEESGPRSLLIVTVIGGLIGMILAFIGAVQLRRFGAGIYVADLVGLAMAREMAAVMTGIVIAGKTGAAFAARIGTMQANEEVDALITLGISPIDFLVLPRVIGLALMMPLLYFYACGVGLAGGMLIGTTVLDLSPTEYWQQTQHALHPIQFMIGLGKSVVFGALVAIAGCMRGIRCGRSAAAVGEATTSAVVTGILYIIITDAIFAVLLEIYGL
jgi:phospholipid/cholesterol/gamma-HCH transport system permease protein